MFIFWKEKKGLTVPESPPAFFDLETLLSHFPTKCWHKFPLASCAVWRSSACTVCYVCLQWQWSCFFRFLIFWQDSTTIYCDPDEQSWKPEELIRQYVPLILVSFYSYSSACTRTPDVISGRTYVPEEKIYWITHTQGMSLGVESIWKPHPSVVSFPTFLTAAIHPKANISVEGPSIRSSPCTSIRKTKGSGNVSGRKRIKKKTALMVFLIFYTANAVQLFRCTFCTKN